MCFQGYQSDCPKTDNHFFNNKNKNYEKDNQIS